MTAARIVAHLVAGLGVISSCLAATAARAEVRLPALFSDHMVMQSDMRTPVWGWADAGEKVTVSLGDQQQTATAGEDGRWSVKFAPMKPGGEPLVMKVEGKNTIEIKDVLVGEVWLCSGQSNMEWTVEKAADFEKERAAASHPRLRMFTVRRAAEPKMMDDVHGEWVVCAPETVGKFSAVGYFFGRRLLGELDRPIGLIHSSWGGTPIEAWTDLAATASVGELRFLADKLRKETAEWTPEAAKKRDQANLERWQKATEHAAKEGTNPPHKPEAEVRPDVDPHRPASLFNGMIAPLVPYGIRGAIWYQGESNAGTFPSLYRLQLETMLADWRARWQEGDFPFIFVQLTGFMKPQQEPSEMNGWSIVREQFLKSLEAIPNAGMAITIDVGEADNIHPANKQAVGWRLAQWALAKVYGKEIVAGGPLFKGMNTKDRKVVCHFDYVDGGLLVKGDKLEGFALAGKDMKFHWAKAEIKGKTVVVSSDEVESPVAVRYSWAQNPKGNLFNKAGFPASPFRSDDWVQ